MQEGPTPILPRNPAVPNCRNPLNERAISISLVTNAAAGVTGEKLNHAEVIAAGKAAADRMGNLLAKVLPKL